MPEFLSDEQLTALRTSLRRAGHARFPLLRPDIDDLAAQTVADLWKYLLERAPGPALGADAIQRIAHAIFNRRAADLFRKTRPMLAAAAVAAPAPATEAEPADERAGDLATTALYRSMLRVCVAELSTISEQDQMAVAIATGLASSAGDALTAAERQRLHRVRKRLAAAIQRELGEDAYKLLRDLS
ncbi:hypothetical protein H3H37_13510 [Duganella sp. LX20W]|uniref:Uncharacterized protein n=1 Tax=Rugamonas brunnea TaxID=2758569 RepID=A0A7W2ESZ8_9BURK|nr:hypothetical protein [Rugamonas brunnea]MBA5638073.1 hypothetical protein [Rugamonas brunnea]